MEEALIEAGDGEAVRAIPRLARLEYAGPADPGARLKADAWPTLDGWSYRVRDAAGQELLRARLEPLVPAVEPV
ncbi:MAG: hypothetical protein ACREER_12110 [Alphaproteobacteria bacterium]